MEDELTQRTENVARNEILGNQSALVEWMLQNDDTGRFMDELHNLHQSYKEAAQDEGWELIGDDGEEFFFRSPFCESESGSDTVIQANDEDEAWEELCNQEWIEPDQREPLEWWWIGRAGSFLERDLNEIGAVLLYHPETDDVWWGRTESGQALSYDSDLREVVRRLQERTTS